MADTVRVQFSASIGALIKGVEDAKKAIESVRESTDRVTEGAKELLEAFGVGFSVDKIVEFVGAIAELGEQVERTSAILGTSTKETQELGFIAQITGGSADTLALSMERLQVNLMKAQSGAGPAATALQALGLSAKELIGLPLDEQMNRIADAVSRFADGGNKTAIVMALLGRGGAQMIPVLDQGRAGLDALRDAADQSGAVMTTQTVEALSSVEHGLVTMKAAATGLGGALVGEFAGAINAATKGMTDFLGDLSALIVAGNFGKAAIEEFSGAIYGLGANLANTGVLAKDFFTLDWGKLSADWKAGSDQIRGIAQQTDANVNDMIEQSRAKMRELLAETASSGKPNAPGMAAPGGGGAAISGLQEQMKLADEQFKMVQQHLDAELKLGQITEGEKTRTLLAELDKRKAAEDGILAQEAQVGGLSVAQQQKVADEKLTIDQKYAADRQKIVDQAMEADVKAWQSALTPIQSAWDSQLKGLLAGTTSWASAMKNIFADLVMDIIKFFEKLALEKLATSLATAFGDPAAMIAGATKAITTSVGQLYAGEAAFFAPTLGPGAPAAAAGIAAGVQATALGMAALDTGAWSIPREGMAMLHPGETVLPAAAAQTFRSMAEGSGPGGGNVTHNWNVAAIDARSFASMLSDHSSVLYRQIQAGIRNAALKPV